MDLPMTLRDIRLLTRTTTAVVRTVLTEALINLAALVEPTSRTKTEITAVETTTISRTTTKAFAGESPDDLIRRSHPANIPDPMMSATTKQVLDRGLLELEMFLEYGPASPQVQVLWPQPVTEPHKDKL